jgi:serine/threonine protein kinase
MDERYEIRGKLGQGGIGAVYRAFDQRMNREVAIKRIITEGGVGNPQDEATRQLTQEAGALAALQHPHIVTVYDVGLDEDGPYVVMELLTGKSLDEVVEKGAPLTFQDFRELAMQTQEALIAAQELNIVHRDLKPGNVMLTWLPSGKFQVKIVDFGLAKFTPKPSLQTLDQGDSVFGSIFFMAPEQFERIPLDARTDMYAMGCVYYFALTGLYPFDGETGPQVMAAHLSHRVTPIGEVRADLSQWVCDWVMWQINRNPDDRPANARESLQNFLRNDNPANASIPMSAPVLRIDPSKRPRLINPAADAPPPPSTSTAPQPLQPPEGSKPSLHTATQAVPVMVNPTSQLRPTTQLHPTAARRVPVAVAPVVPPKKKADANRKLIIGGCVALAVLILGIVLLQRSDSSRQEEALRALIQQAADPATTELRMNGGQLKGILGLLLQPRPAGEQQTIFRALRAAKATDITDVDLKISEFAINAQLSPEARAGLFFDVLRRRASNSGAALVAEFARTTEDEKSAEAALQSLWATGGDGEFVPLLETIQTRKAPALRNAAKTAALEVLKRSSDKKTLLAQLDNAIRQASDEPRGLLLELKLSIPPA